MNAFFSILRQHPELTVFLILALGFAIGLIRIGTFRIGAVLGSLLAGVLIGQIGIEIAPVVKIVFFDLFLFATGYKVGPQFFRGLKKDALPQLALTFVICTSCLLIAFLMARLFGYDMGTATGMLAGAFTESTVIGTAAEAIMRLPIPDEQKTQFINNIPVAYAVTYLIGTTALVWFLSSLAPKIMRIDLKEEGRKLGLKLEGTTGADPGIDSAFQEWSFRAFRVEKNSWAGLSISEIENTIPDSRIFIQRLRQRGELLQPFQNTIINQGDTLAIRARQKVMLELHDIVGPEIDDKELLDFPIAFREIIVSKKKAVTKTLGKVVIECGYGVVLHKLIREGQEVPFNSHTTLDYGDLMKVSGRSPDIEYAAKEIGYIESVHRQLI